MLPGEGGEHLYLGHGFGPWAVRLYDWMSFFVLRPSSIAFFSMKFVIILWATVTTVEPSALKILGCVSLFIAGVTLLTIVLPSLSGKLEKVFTWIKIFSLFTIVVLSLGYVCWNRDILGRNLPGYTPIPDDKGKIPERKIGEAITLAVLTFDGWNGLNTVAGRFANPSKTIPSAIVLGTGFITGIYLMVALSYFFVFDFRNREFIEKNYSIFQALAAAFISKEQWGKWIGNVFILAAVFSSTLAWISSGVEAFEVAVADGSLPKFLQKKNKIFKTPHITLILQALLTIVFCLGPYGLAKLTTKDLSEEILISKITDAASFFGVFPYCIFYVMTVMVLIREKHWAPSPITTHSFKAFLPLPYIYTVATCILIGLLAVLNFQTGELFTIIVTVSLMVLMLVMVAISVFGDKSFAKRKLLLEKQKAVEVEKIATTLDLDKETPLPPQVVEKTFL